MKLTINVIMMLLLFVCSATISAQTNEKGYMVAGTVMDEKGETIIGTLEIGRLSVPRSL